MLTTVVSTFIGLNLHGAIAVYCHKYKKNINDYISLGGVAVVPGFQGISKSGDITSIGRGGSDATAVAIAKIFQTDSCEIYTDVDLSLIHI